MVWLLPPPQLNLLLLFPLQVNSDVLLGGLRYRINFFTTFFLCCPWQNIFTIGTCEEIQIALTGGAASVQTQVPGLYVKSGTSNGEPVWGHCSEHISLWKASNGYWIVGPDSSIGVSSGNMFNTVGSGPPYANGDDWYYFNGAAWINPVGEIEVECTSK